MSRYLHPVAGALGILTIATFWFWTALSETALFLASKARATDFDTAFYAVQALELIAGSANIALLGLNMRDGLKMKVGSAVGQRPV